MFSIVVNGCPNASKFLKLLPSQSFAPCFTTNAIFEGDKYQNGSMPKTKQVFRHGFSTQGDLPGFGVFGFSGFGGGVESAFRSASSGVMP
jgi:hypothetical protein